MRDLWRHWGEVRRAYRAHRRFAFLLDFDGTLSPIAPTPGEARLPRSVRDLLRRLNRRRGVTVAVVSGRALADVRANVGLPALAYAGNHGLQIRGPGFSFRHPWVALAGPALRLMRRRLRREIAKIPGSLLEDKGMGLTLHHRLVRSPHAAAFRRLLGRLRAWTNHRPLRWHVGRKVVEFQPDVPWNKGKAALYLLRRLGNPYPVAIGDDRTDEDMFKALEGRGLTIRVGRRRASRARFYLRGQAQVSRFLRETLREWEAS